MAESDAEKLDELKRVLRRLDKTLTRAPEPSQPAHVRSGPAGRGNATVLRTVLLAGSVSLIVSFAVATLIFHNAPERRFVVSEGQLPVVEKNAGDADPQELQTGPQVPRQASGDITPQPPAATPAASVQVPNAPSPPIETGGTVKTDPASDARTAAPTHPEPTLDNATTAQMSRTALVELDAAQFTRRGLLMLSRGSIGAAQLLLERAADLGSGEAAFALASTYDGAPGAPRHGPEIRPNEDLALRWYARAETLGVEEASKRLAALKKGETAPGK